MHWLTVTPVVGVPTGTLLITVTLQVTLLPPPVTMPLHWSTEVTSWVGFTVTVVWQPNGGSTPATAKQVVAVTFELVAPWAVMVFSILTVQVTWNPAPVGMPSRGLHWLAAAVGAAGAAAVGAAAVGAAAVGAAAVGVVTVGAAAVGAAAVGVVRVAEELIELIGATGESPGVAGLRRLATASP